MQLLGIIIDARFDYRLLTHWSNRFHARVCLEFPTEGLPFRKLDNSGVQALRSRPKLASTRLPGMSAAGTAARHRKEKA
jgi:hypothetical protein